MIALVVIAGALGAASIAASGSRWFDFETLNRSYRNTVGTLAPVASGPFEVTLSSPANVVILHRNRVRLTPRPDGTFGTILDLEVAGGGVLEADVTVVGVGTRLADRVVAPRQRLEVPGRARIERAVGGLEITPLELPRQVRIAIRSALGSRVVGWCERTTVFLSGASDCSDLEESMSTVTVGLPVPGDTYFVPREEIGERDWEAVTEFLEEHGVKRVVDR